ncbi:Glycerol-3-phosphate acyltransferase [[Clostridium] ultunense Esp]|nr:Glycerol-3-phosphate acyltransferase [[Clostridium] ultunense Esp]
MGGNRVFWILLIFAYLLGSVPFSVIFANMKGINLLECGSRNPGSTNAFRCAGPLVGTAALICDILKGFLAVWIADLLLEPIWQVYLVGVFAILGHTKSLFLGFKGGKAIATSSGVFLYIATWPILMAAVIFAITLLLWRMVSLASIMGGIAFPLFVLLTDFKNPLLILISFAVAAYAIWRHRGNIERIRRGTEQKIFEKGKKRVK